MDKSEPFEPRIISFVCKWCTSAAADLAGVTRLKYLPNAVNIRLMCSSRVDPLHILEAFRNGADGVFVGGCHLGECHYQVGNFKTRRRVIMLHELIKSMGISQKRLRLEWISASEGPKFKSTINDFVKTIKQLGPLDLDGSPGITGGDYE